MGNAIGCTTSSIQTPPVRSQFKERRARRLSACVLVLSYAPLLPACGDEATTVLRAEPGEDLPGGETTNTLLLGSNAFTTPVSNISPDNEAKFHAGNSFFNQPWVAAPASTQSRDGLGPLFNARSCAACHFKDGRGSPPLEQGDPFVGLLLRLSIDGSGKHGAATPHPVYGGQLQPFSIPGVPAEGMPRVSYVEREGEYADGTRYTLLEPVYTITDLAYGDLPKDIRISPRVAPAVHGLGLLEAVSEARLAELADPNDQDADGISGRISRVPDAATGELSVGRFGWKSEQPSVRQQSAGAFLGDMGITTSLFPSQECSSEQTECQTATAGGDPEISDAHLERVERYGQLLAVPVRTDASDSEVLQGKKLFQNSGCAGCHTPRHLTENHPLSELEDQEIWPYTDLLLHDMGEGLSDNRPSYSAAGSEWRTPPLWGLRFYETVNRHNRLLHDGRARGVAEAILWHGGEAKESKQAFESMSKSDRDALVRFVESL